MSRSSTSLFAAALVGVALVSAGCTTNRCRPACRPACGPTARPPAVTVVGPTAALAPAPAGTAPAPSAADRAAMEAEMMRLAQPGPEHARLAKLAGEWNVHGKFWFGSPEPVESEMTASSKMIMGGRYLSEEVQGSFQGMPFEGRALTGYDNAKKQWFSTWIDNMGTGLMTSVGRETETGKAWEWTGEMQMPQGPVRTRQTMRWTGDDALVFEMWTSSPQGETKAMELQYKRK